jgi:AcrR family transcriptional regulator
VYVVTKGRPLRADAERNRRRVLEVAQQVFAAEGLAVPIDEIARRAGLGVGTLYRHFPTKEALFAAIVVTRMEEATSHACSLLDSEDPAATLFDFLVHMVAGWNQKKDFIDALMSAGADLKEVVRAKTELHDVIGKLLGRAQKTGQLRKDVSAREILALIGGAFGAFERHGIDKPGLDRMLAVVFDGLRVPAAAVSRTKLRRA